MRSHYENICYREAKVSVKARLHVISIKMLREFSERYPDAAEPLRTWYKTAEKAQWTSIVDVRQTYPHADFVDPRYTVFNIRGGNYRLVVEIVYAYKLIYVQHVLTHAEYDANTWK